MDSSENLRKILENIKKKILYFTFQSLKSYFESKKITNLKLDESLQNTDIDVDSILNQSMSSRNSYKNNSLVTISEYISNSKPSEDKSIHFKLNIDNEKDDRSVLKTNKQIDDYIYLMNKFDETSVDSFNFPISTNYREDQNEDKLSLFIEGSIYDEIQNSRNSDFQFGENQITEIENFKNNCINRNSAKIKLKDSKKAVFVKESKFKNTKQRFDFDSEEDSCNENVEKLEILKSYKKKLTDEKIKKNENFFYQKESLNEIKKNRINSSDSYSDDEELNFFAVDNYITFSKSGTILNFIKKIERLFVKKCFFFIKKTVEEKGKKQKIILYNEKKKIYKNRPIKKIIEEEKTVKKKKNFKKKVSNLKTKSTGILECFKENN